MAGLAELMGIQMPGGGQEAATDPGAVAPDAGGGWGAALKDPVMKSALLSFGLQAMTGGWGNGVQQAAAAVGAGAQGAAGTAKAMNEFSQEERGRTDKLAEGSANRKQSETNARIGADSRAEVANIRSQAMLERTTMNLNRAQPSQQLRYRTEARKVYEGNLSNMSKSQGDREAEIEQLAAQMYATDNARAPGSGGATSQTGAPSAGGPGATTGTPGAEAAKSTSKAGQKPSWSQLMRNPKFVEKAQTPEGQAQILAERPDLKGNLDAYLAPIN